MTVAAVALAPSPTTAPPDGPARPAQTWIFVPLLVGAMGLVWLPAAYHWYWAPRMVLLALAVPAGVALLAAGAAKRSRPHLAALAFLGVAAGSSALASVPVLSLLGRANGGGGLLAIAGAVAIWSLVRSAPAPFRRHSATALVIVLVVNGTAALLQALGANPVPELDWGNRAAGLLGNPVHLGAVASAGVALAARRSAGPTLQARWLLLVALLCSASQLSGGRSALALAAVALVVGARTAPPRRLPLIAAAALSGLLAASMANWVGPADSATASSRLAEAGAGTPSGVATRLSAWQGGIAATREQPVLGWGPGRFLEAAQRHTTLDAALAEPGALFEDAHSWPIQYLATTGMLGLATLGWWLAEARRRARGPFACFASVIAVAGLVQPLSLVTLALGVAALALATPPDARRLSRRAAAGAGLAQGAVVGLVALFLAGELSLASASRDFDRAAVRRAVLLHQPWPTPALVGTRVLGFYAAGDDSAAAEALELARVATRRDPFDPATWERLGNLEGVWGDAGRAAVAFDRARALNPWSPSVLAGAEKAHGVLGQTAAQEGICRRLERLDVRSSCGP